VYFSARPEDLPIAIPDSQVATAEELIERFSITNPTPLRSSHVDQTAEWEYQLTRKTYLDL
jgi:hypothetical protein